MIIEKMPNHMLTLIVFLSPSLPLSLAFISMHFNSGYNMLVILLVNKPLKWCIVRHVSHLSLFNIVQTSVLLQCPDSSFFILVCVFIAVKRNSFKIISILSTSRVTARHSNVSQVFLFFAGYIFWHCLLHIGFNESIIDCAWSPAGAGYRICFKIYKGK